MYLIAQKDFVMREKERTFLPRHILPSEVLECEDWDCILMDLIQKKQVDYLFVDVNVLGLSWVNRLSDLLEKTKTIHVVLTAENLINKDIILNLVQKGLWGFITYQDLYEYGKEIFQLLFKNGRYFPISLFTLSWDEKKVQEEIILPTGEKLTKRQKEVLSYLKKGLSNKQIAGKMNISEPTIKMHIHGLFNKLHATNRTQIVLRASELNID